MFRIKASETMQFVRPVGINIVAMAAVGVEMSIQGRNWSSLLLASVIALLGCLLIIEVYRHVRRFHDRSSTVQLAARQAESHYINVLRRIIH